MTPPGSSTFSFFILLLRVELSVRRPQVDWGHLGLWVPLDVHRLLGGQRVMAELVAAAKCTKPSTLPESGISSLGSTPIQPQTSLIPWKITRLSFVFQKTEGKQPEPKCIPQVGAMLQESDPRLSGCRPRGLKALSVSPAPAPPLVPLFVVSQAGSFNCRQGDLS